MPRKKSSEKRVSDFPDRVKLFETTARYVAAESEATGESRAEVIRVLCEEARRARMNESRAKYELSSAVRDAQQKIVNRAFESIAEKFEICARQITSLETEVKTVKERLGEIGDEFQTGRREQTLALSNIFWLAQKIWCEIFALVFLIKNFVFNSDSGNEFFDEFETLRERERLAGMQTLNEWHRQRKLSQTKDEDD